MKRIFFIAIACLAAMVSCKQNSYVVKGTAPEECEGREITLEYGEVSDTTTIQNGQFCFNGEITNAERALVCVYKENKKPLYTTYFIIEPGKISVELSENSVCSGTPLNDSYASYQAQQKLFTDEYRKNMSEFNESDLEDVEKRARMDEIWEAYKAKTDSLNSVTFQEHSNDIIGAMAMLSLAGGKKPVFDSLYVLAGDKVKIYSKVQKELNRLDKVEKTSEGRMFTDFEVANGNPDGSAVKLSDYVGKGKYILVDFWASWCGPCKAEIRNLAGIYPKYKSDKFDILGVAVWDERADTEKALETLPISWPVILDAQRIPTDLYGINGIPELVLIGPDGMIVKRGLRGKAIPEFLDTIL